MGLVYPPVWPGTLMLKFARDLSRPFDPPPPPFVNVGFSQRPKLEHTDGGDGPGRREKSELAH